jgi:SAM-dependent methyltransferase
MKRKILKFIIDKAKRSKLIQSVFEQPIDLKQFKIKGSFVDCHGIEHKLYENLRSKIKPGWERIFQADIKVYDKSSRNIEQIAQNGRIAIGRMEPILNLYSRGIKNSTILEIGCSAGGNSYALAEKQALEVIGTEFSGYKISSLEEKEIKQDDLKEVNKSLNEIRQLVGSKFSLTEKLSFVDDDICNSKLQPGSFDIICSWDVLEHLHDPLKAFKNIRKLLKEGGVAIHEYNPFFSLVGGHSACTIDFPWGHIILNEQDFKRYNEQFYPENLNTAMSFYLNGINRMTIKDLSDLSAEAGLEILSLLVFPKEQDLRMMNKEIMKMIKTNYPNVSLNDLISPRIIVIHRKIG